MRSISLLPKLVTLCNDVAANRVLYNRALFDALFPCEVEISPRWREHLKVDGVIITDAKGLNGHMNKTGSMASEKTN